MSAKYNSRQCLLNRNGLRTVSWIPEKFAIVGKFLKLKEENGWQVEEVYDPAMAYEDVNERSQDYKKTRIASDI